MLTVGRVTFRVAVSLSRWVFALKIFPFGLFWTASPYVFVLLSFNRQSHPFRWYASVTLIIWRLQSSYWGRWKERGNFVSLLKFQAIKSEVGSCPGEKPHLNSRAWQASWVVGKPSNAGSMALKDKSRLLSGSPAHTTRTSARLAFVYR